LRLLKKGVTALEHSSRDDIFAAHSYLIRPIALRLAQRLPQGFLLEDLEQLGAIGLLELIDEQYDPARAASFGVLARCRIKGAMLDAIKGKEYREATRPSIDADNFGPVADTRPSPEETAIAAIDGRRVVAAITDLPPRQKAVVRLRVRGMTQTAAGRVLGISQYGAGELERRAIAGVQRRLAAA